MSTPRRRSSFLLVLAFTVLLRLPTTPPAASAAPPFLADNITGRVVLASDPDQGVPKVLVSGYPEELELLTRRRDDAAGAGARPIHATTDADGRFRSRPHNAASLVGAFSEDKSLGANTRIDADQTEFTLELAPTAAITGTLFDEDTNGGPAANREVDASIRVGPKDGPFVSAFKQSAKTDSDGAFTITGLIPDHNYEVSVVTEKDDKGQAQRWRNVGKAAPTAAGELALGELRIPKPYRPPTVEDDIERAYVYNPAARLQRLLIDARLAFGQILVVAGNPVGKAARRYFEICWHNSMGPQNELTPPNLREYMVLAVDPANAVDPATGEDFFDAHKLPAPSTDNDATFIILNPDSSIVAQSTSADLSKDGQLDAKLLAGFLADRRAPLPNARRLLDEALAEAARDDKRVLVQVGGPGCGWCVVLARYLDQQKHRISKDYIHLKLDSRMPEAKEVIGELRKSKELGIPWMIILAADGQPLVTSDAEDGNIGYPNDRDSQAHWEKMLRETRKRLTDEDLAVLLQRLTEEN